MIPSLFRRSARACLWSLDLSLGGLALAAIRSGKWKLSLHPNLTLYNLEEDPGERSPVNDWKVKTKLRGMVIQYLREMKK